MDGERLPQPSNAPLKDGEFLTKLAEYKLHRSDVRLFLIVFTAAFQLHICHTTTVPNQPHRRFVYFFMHGVRVLTHDERASSGAECI